jgi:soluble lytic murein transglycosylase-like protein
VQYGGIPPYPETQNYVRRITERYSQSENKQQ